MPPKTPKTPTCTVADCARPANTSIDCCTRLICDPCFDDWVQEHRGPMRLGTPVDGRFYCVRNCPHCAPAHWSDQLRLLRQQVRQLERSNALLRGQTPRPAKKPTGPLMDLLGGDVKWRPLH